MPLHLITGYAGEEHITSADQGAYNMGTYGEGEFVLDRGSKFEATVVSNNSITIADGEAMMQGRYIRLAAGTSESVSIDNGSQGMNRRDLICIHYEKDSGTGVEAATLVVKKGTESSSTPSDPSYTTGDITDGTDLINEMPLYRVNLSGLSISSVDTLYSLKVPMVEYMDNYQLPVATSSVLGGVKVGTGLQMDNQKLSLKAASGGALGGVSIISASYDALKNGLSVLGGVLSIRPRVYFSGYTCPLYESKTFSAGFSHVYVDFKRSNFLSITGLDRLADSLDGEGIANAIRKYLNLYGFAFEDANGNIAAVTSNVAFYSIDAEKITFRCVVNNFTGASVTIPSTTNRVILYGDTAYAG